MAIDELRSELKQALARIEELETENTRLKRELAHASQQQQHVPVAREEPNTHESPITIVAVSAESLGIAEKLSEQLKEKVSDKKNKVLEK